MPYDSLIQSVLIDRPEFTFIFTVNLDGKLDIYNDIETYAWEKGTGVVPKIPGNRNAERDAVTRRQETEIPISLDRYYFEKDEYLKNLLGTCRDCTKTPWLSINLGTKQEGGSALIKEIPRDLEGKVEYNVENNTFKLSRLTEYQKSLFKKCLDQRYHDQIEEALRKCCAFSYKKMEDQNLSPFVDNTFIQGAVIGCWRLRQTYVDNEVTFLDPIKSILDREEHFPEEIVFHIKREDGEYSECHDINEIRLNLNSELKIFSTGSISIRIKIKLYPKNNSKGVGVALNPYDLITLIKFPNLVAEEFGPKEQQKGEKKKRVGDKKTGILNIVAYNIANATFSRFFECLAQPGAREKASILRIHRIVPKPEPPDRYEIVERFENITYTNRHSYLYVSPYIGVKIYDNPEAFINPKTGKYNDIAGQVLLAIATQTKEFLTDLRNGTKYLRDNSLTRGKQDAMLIERRGFVAAGTRTKVEGEASLDRPYNTLIFCIESIMATWKSVSSFNKELEEYVSRRVNSFLQVQSVLGNLKKLELYLERHKSRVLRDSLCGLVKAARTSKSKLLKVCRFILRKTGRIFAICNPITMFLNVIRLGELREIVNKARTLSPCEDFSSNIIPYLKSEISIRGSKKLRDFGLSELIDTVHGRLENYGHFLKTSQESHRVQAGLFIAIVMLIITIVEILKGNLWDNIFN